MAVDFLWLLVYAAVGVGVLCGIWTFLFGRDPYAEIDYEQDRIDAREDRRETFEAEKELRQVNEGAGDTYIDARAVSIDNRQVNISNGKKPKGENYGENKGDSGRLRRVGSACEED